MKPILPSNLFALAIRPAPRLVAFALIATLLPARLGLAAPPDVGAIAASIPQTSFEECEPGRFTAMETKIGKWSAPADHAEVDAKHHFTGSHCLHLFGGERRTVEFTPNVPGAIGRLAFQAERWTKRDPFYFRVEAFSRGKWAEIYNGDRQVVIGTFSTEVRIDLNDDAIERFRFVCTSPAKAGLLIDDVQLLSPSPQRVVAIKAEAMTLPALVGTAASPLLRLRVDVDGTREPISLTAVTVTLDGTSALEDLASVHLFATGPQPMLRATGHPHCFASAIRFDTQPPARSPISFSGQLTLKPGANHLWIAATLKPTANADHVVQAGCNMMAFSNGQRCNVATPPTARPQRIGVAVRKQGDDGAHTSRIPGLATTTQGTLIGVYDVRRQGGGDLPGDIDVGMSRSTDGGRTWEPMRVIMNMGDDPKWRFDGIGDPAVLVDQNTGTIWVGAVWSHGNRAWFGSGPGMTPAETGQFMLVRSDDDGLTWSDPINITSQIKQAEWCYLLQGPGKGITMQDGTLVFAAQYQDTLASKRLPRSTIIYSRDHGTTWQIGTGAFDDTTEAQVVEIEPGVLMLNCRYNRESARVVMVTRDMGQTWQVHPTSRQALIEPRACMASLIDVDRELGVDAQRGDAGGWLLFSNPDSTRARERISLKASPDRGQTWPREHTLLLDAGRGAGYSCLTMIDAETVGILYEGSLAHMTFQRIKLADLTRSPKAPKKSVRLSWEALPDLPDELGVAGPFVGVHREALIVAGGANFPRPVWDNDKVWRDRIHVLTKSGGQHVWHDGGTLDRPTAYGATVSTPDGIVCIGGNDASKTFADVLLLQWDPAAKRARTTPYPPLPQPCAYGAATLVGDVIYLAGGQSGQGLDSSMTNFWSLDLAQRRDPEKFVWQRRRPWPGTSRAFNLTVHQRRDGDDRVYVISGRRQQGETTQFLRDVWEYTPSSDRWHQREDTPRCVMAGTGIGFGKRQIVVLGGADGSLFFQGNELRDKHPGFVKEALVYDTLTDRWASAGPIPRNHVTTQAVRWGGGLVIASGEVRPRVRSAKVWGIRPLEDGR